MLKSEQIPMEVQDALNKAHGFIVSPQALASAINAWPGMTWACRGKGTPPHLLFLPLPTESSND
jgi:hypothetical protein